MLQCVCLKMPLAPVPSPEPHVGTIIPFFASLKSSAAEAWDDVFIKFYDLLILIICCVS